MDFKGKVGVQPRTGHEDLKGGSRGKALLFS